MAMVASPSCPPPPPQFHVLAVDDSVLDRKLIERLLRTSSYHVTAVDSVTKALEFLGMQHHQGGATTTSSSCSSSSTTSSSSAYLRHQQEINLIITDYCMPGMTGYDLLKTVKGSGSPLKDIPVVIMSSENVPARINRCLEEGADEFLLKPVKLSDMSKLRPRVLKGETQTTSNTNHGDDKEVGTTGNQGMLQEQMSISQVEVMELPHEQILLLGRQVLDCATASDEAAAAAVTGDAASDVDSPRSNKRKAAQGNGAVSIQDHRARTTTTVTTTASSSSRSTVASLFVL